MGGKKDYEKKRQREQEMVSEMILLYCRKKHGTGARGPKELCEACGRLEVYARERSRRCPFMEHKTFCSNCRVHCYKPEMREKIREVMRFSGPRMIFYHPLQAVYHVICTVQEKKRQKKETMHRKEK